MAQACSTHCTTWLYCRQLGARSVMDCSPVHQRFLRYGQVRSLAAAWRCNAARRSGESIVMYCLAVEVDPLCQAKPKF